MNIKCLYLIKYLSCLIVLMVGVLNFSIAQTKISGKVTDSKGKTLPGVSIFIKGSYDGTTSLADGTYSFNISDVGTDTIVASFIGFNNFQAIVKADKQPIVLNIILKDKANTLNVVTISAGSFEASDERKATVLKPLDIVTTAGAGGDITGAIKTLPGTQQVNGQTGLFVRGGTAEETQTFIDGMRVNNPYFSTVPDIASRGRFSPFLFKGTVFTSGGYSALYGDALSAALILESQDFPDRSSATLALSSVGIGGGLQHLSKDKKFSFGLNVNYTNLQPYLSLAKTSVGYNPYPVYYNIEGNFRRQFKNKGVLKFYGYLNSNRLAIQRDSIGVQNVQRSFELQNKNVYANMTYKQSVGKSNRLLLGASYTYNKDSFNIGNIFNGNTYPLYHFAPITQVAEARAVLTHYFGTLSSLKVGGDFEWDQFKSTFPFDTGTIKGTFTSRYAPYNWTDRHTALFAESDIYITTKLVGRIGLRGEHASVLDSSNKSYNIAPRLSLAYKTSTNGQISLAYGQFFEKPFAQYLFANTPYTFMKATHYLLNYQIILPLRTLRIEAYYKQYYNLIKTTPVINNSGNGYAKGVELFWRDKKTFKNFDYWLSMTYLDTKRNWLNYPILTQPTFAAKYNASLVVKKYFAKIRTSLGATYTYSTGFPYYNPNKPSSDYLSDYTKDYNALNVSASYLTTFLHAFTVLVVGVNNVLNTNNIYGYRYSEDGKTRIAIGPVVNRFVFVGCFMSWGIDRRQEVLDNN